MDIYELIAEKRPEILALADKYAIKNIRIFGSVARREATKKTGDPRTCRQVCHKKYPDLRLRCPARSHQ